MSHVRALRALLFFLPLLTGCKPATPLMPSHALAAPGRPTDSPTIQTTPAYRKAVRLYRSGDREASAKAIDRLLAQPSLTPADIEFLQRQKAISERPAAKPDVGRGLRPAPSPANLTHHESRIIQDCGPRALQIVLTRFNIPSNLDSLRKECATTDKGSSLEGLARAAKAHGLKAEGIQVNREALNELETPAIAWANGNHYIAVLKVKDKRATIIDPNLGREEVIETEELLRRSGGILFTLSR